VGGGPMIRRNGGLEPVAGHSALEDDDVRRLLGALLSGEHWARVDHGQTLDVVCPVPDVARVRVNVFSTSSGLAAVLHPLPWRVPTLEDLGLPSAIGEMIGARAGLVLVGGSIGSGRSTTLAAMVDAAIGTEHRRVVTIESPVEFVHAGPGGMVSHRALGPEASARATALHESIRQDPDIVVVDRIEGADALAGALAVAEAGRLVLGAVNTRTAAATIEGMVLTASRDQRPWVRRQLADSLQGIVCLALCSRADGTGQVAATEVLRMTTELRRLIREGEFAAITGAMANGSADGMHTLDQDLARLVRRGEITSDEAFRHGADADELARLLDT